MTETISDIYGFDSPQYRNYIGSSTLWCIKHKEKYSSFVTTAGIYYHCYKCFEECYKK